MNDETFWQKQEARRRHTLGQPCCTLSGICTVLAAVPGRFCVVIHGERDCANSFLHQDGRSVDRFYCTALSELQATAGQTAAPLQRCLELIVRERAPEVVFVLGSCLVEMIGDRFERVVDQVASSAGIPMVALHTSGLRLGSQQEMLDWSFETLAALSGRDDPRPGSINLVGLPEMYWHHKELLGLLEDMGLALNGSYPHGASLDDWRGIRRAAASFVVDRSLVPRLARRLEEAGQPVVEVPLPLGVAATDDFYRVIAKQFGIEDQAEPILAAARRHARARLEEFRARRGGLRMAMGIRMLNDYRADRLAYQGLGDVRALSEMGFDLALFVQGPPEEDTRREFGDALRAAGCDLPFEVFADPWSLGERLRGRGFDLACLADHGREEAAKAGIPMVPSGSLLPLYAGVEHNLSLMDRLLDESLPPGR